MSSSVAHKPLKYKKQGDPLEKKIPQNPRYQHVQATVDTGASLSKYLRKIEDIKQNYKFRKDEIFKRMKASTFVQLVIQVHRISHTDYYDTDYYQQPPLSPIDDRPETADLEVLRVQNGSPAPSLALTDTDYGGHGEPETGRSTLLGVMRGVGEMDINQASPASSAQPIDDTCPYLLLDIRDRDEFDECHIITATSYPKANLSRAMNYESKEMLTYKNKEGKIILLYDNDEKIAPTSCTTLVQRGYDNVFMLSGGLKVALKMFPDGLTTGTPPVALTGVKARSSGPAEQTQFSNDDVNKIEIYLDNTLQQDKSLGSRLSRATVASSRMSTSSRSTTSSKAPSAIADRPCFKP